MESNQIAKALKSVFKKADMEVLISSNDFRKGAVTAVYDNHKEYRDSLAVLLDHNESTAKRYYRLSDKAKSSVRASKHLATLMRSNEVPDKNEKLLVEDKAASEETSILEEAKTIKKWNDELVETLRAVFAHEINEQSITIDCVREKIKGIEELDKRDAREVLQKIRSQWRFPKKQELSNNTDAELPCETETAARRVNSLLDDDDDDDTSSGRYNRPFTAFILIYIFFSCIFILLL